MGIEFEHQAIIPHVFLNEPRVFELLPTSPLQMPCSLR